MRRIYYKFPPQKNPEDLLKISCLSLLNLCTLQLSFPNFPLKRDQLHALPQGKSQECQSVQRDTAVGPERASLLLEDHPN